MYIPQNVVYIKKGRRQVNEKSFNLKEGIKGWYKKGGDKTGMDGWMDVAVVITLESY